MAEASTLETPSGIEMEPPPGIALDTPAGAELETPAGVGARTLGVAAFTSGMGPLLGHWIESGALTAEPELAALLGLHLHHGRERARLLTEELHRAVSLLAQAGIIPIVIKGMHTGAVYFPEPGTRPASDIDLVVGPAEAEAAGAALFAAGYEETNRQSRPYKSDWVPPGASRTLRSLEVTHRDNPLTLDLHTTLDRNFFGVGTVAFGPLGDSATRRHTVGDAQVRVLEQPLLTASLAAHASEGLPNCRPWTGPNRSPSRTLQVSSSPLIVTLALAQRTATGLMSTPVTRYPFLPAKMATIPDPVPMSSASGRAPSWKSVAFAGRSATARARRRPVRNMTGSWTCGRTKIGIPST